MLLVYTGLLLLVYMYNCLLLSQSVYKAAAVLLTFPQQDISWISADFDIWNNSSAAKQREYYYKYY